MDDAPGYLDIAPGQEAYQYPKCKEFNRDVNHLPNMFHGGGRRLGGVQTTMVYGLLLLIVIPWLHADIQIGVSLIQLYRFGDASYTLQSALFGVGLLLLVLWIVYTNIRIATWTLNIRGTYLEATLNILLAIIVLDYDERVWSLRLLWQRRAYLRERKRGRKLGGYSYFGDDDGDDD